MPVKITKANAKSIVDSFASSSADDFLPVETFGEVFVIAGELVEDAQKYLKSSNKIASGSLISSIVAINPRKVGDVVSIDIQMNKYGLFVNKGVKGTKSGKSNAGYAFKKAGPSTAFVEAIEKWIDVRGSKVTKYKQTYKSHEAKSKSVGDIAKSAAWVIGRSIMRKGIKPNGFFDKAVDNAKRKYADRLGAALEIDIINSITK